MCGTKMAAGRARGARKRAHAASGRPRERSTADQFAAAHSALRSISWHHRAPRGANCAGYATYTPGLPKGRLQGVDSSAPVALRGAMPPDGATPSVKRLKTPSPYSPTNAKGGSIVAQEGLPSPHILPCARTLTPTPTTPSASKYFPNHSTHSLTHSFTLTHLPMRSAPRGCTRGREDQPKARHQRDHCHAGGEVG